MTGEQRILTVVCFVFVYLIGCMYTETEVGY